MATSIIISDAEDLTDGIEYAASWIEIVRASLKRSGKVITFSGVFRTLQSGIYGNPSTSGRHPLCRIPEKVRPNQQVDGLCSARFVNTQVPSATDFHLSNVVINSAGDASQPGLVYPLPELDMNSGGTIRFSISWVI